MIIAWPCFVSDAWPQVLARINLARPVTELSLPVYARLQDVSGQDYVLAVTGKNELKQSGWTYQILDSGGQPSDFIMAFDRRPLRRPLSGSYNVVHDDGRHLIIRATALEAERIAEQGYEIKRLPEKPIVWTEAVSGRQLQAKRAVTYNGLVADMISQVTTTNLYKYVYQITGASNAVIGGELYPLPTRNTTKQVQSHKAAQYMYQHLQALGLNVSYHHWNAGGYSNCNVVAVLPGRALSNEIVVAVAHLDDTSDNASLAPGADDNASGSVGVLTAASIMSKYRFDRTIRFVIVTGEEQGLYGSQRYAEMAKAASNNIKAVISFDMIAWDSDASPTLRLYTRGVSDPGYAGDRAIAATFTNVVTAYGMAGHLTPGIYVDSDWASDHASFWDNGFPAILAIEDDWEDFNEYYHSTNDTLSRLNMTYYTWFVKAGVGTLAHLAGPVEKVPFDLIQVDNGNWIYGSGVGVGTLYVKHEAGATETGMDGHDLAWSNTVANPNSKWLKIYTQPYSSLLQTDARPTNSETLFHGMLVAVNTNAGAFTSTNLLRFTYLASAESNRIYTVKIHVNGSYTSDSQNFDCVTNLRQVVAGNGFIRLPGLVNLTNGALYGTCDISSRPLVTEPTGFPLRIDSIDNLHVGLGIDGQVGATLVDVLETSTNLLKPGGGWSAWIVFTNYVAPNATNFEAGWQALNRNADLPFTNAAGVYFRFRRQWQMPLP